MNTTYLDAHVQVAFDAPAGAPSSVDDVLRRMDLNGIAEAVLTPHSLYETADGIASSARQNDALRAAIDLHPDRFAAGLGVVEPRHGRRAAGEARRVVEDLGLAGLSFDSDANGIPIDSPSVDALLDAVAARPGVVLSFVTVTYSVLRSSFRLGIVARRHPDLRFLAHNAFMDITHEVASYDLAERCPNIWFSLSRAKTQLSTVERAVESVGADRVIFGSAIPEVSRSHHLEMVRIAEIDDATRAAVLGGNARNLFGLTGATA